MTPFFRGANARCEGEMVRSRYDRKVLRCRQGSTDVEPHYKESALILVGELEDAPVASAHMD